ncbi:NtaA/DmoA family FMN-dependent monooxygenase [Frondihabitans australicus]|uniref:FMN-dependent oxidoreductase (Nitrilotriacetate monooxygenase family) n=1 Tax=Frondihabitans australicus TaxID=386892 RepID=A0A495IG87_9MICO|nr:NtaA/DmoA family FMN-dependent monooxygenase [Frondihabitans australicus]RKR75032.1 FMN-dependent oxidoreductase (nitrilotriacetate monooxygenase family) [Frondihabitans australicus]
MKQIHLGVFEVAGTQVGGTRSWYHERSDSVRNTDLDMWIGMAKILDEAGFDFLFFADGYGYPSKNGDLPEMAARGGINFGGIDPSLLIPTLARETKRLGFVVTSPTGIDHPLQTARRFATLDHLTGGRIGWNIVTGGSGNTVAELFGHTEMMKHDDRYGQADEYVDLALTFWEGCWEDDARVADKELEVFADRSKLHRIEFSGSHFRSSGYFTVPPSPQRTPVLFQAGTSARGREFASRNAEAVFVQYTTGPQTAANVADIRARATAQGRDPQSIVTMVGLSVTVAPTSAEAHRLRAEFDAMQNDEVVSVLYAGNTGIDLLALDPSRDLTQLRDSGSSSLVGQIAQSNIDRFLPTDGTPAPTVREILDDLKGKGTRGLQLVGDPIEVADALEAIMDETDLDGFLIEPLFGTADCEDFATLVVPELRRRGRMPASPATGTLRAQVTGGGAHLAADHPGRRFVVTPAAVTAASV